MSEPYGDMVRGRHLRSEGCKQSVYDQFIPKEEVRYGKRRIERRALKGIERCGG